jgi:hypothetical protein
VYKQILVNPKLQFGKRAYKTAEWEKYIKEAKVRIGKWCDLRRRGTKRCSLFVFVADICSPEESFNAVIRRSFKKFCTLRLRGQ